MGGILGAVIETAPQSRRQFSVIAILPPTGSLTLVL